MHSGDIGPGGNVEESERDTDEVVADDASVTVVATPFQSAINLKRGAILDQMVLMPCFLVEMYDQTI